MLVGLDPRADQMPEGVWEHGISTDAAQIATAFERFCTGVIDAVAPLVGAVKPQMAFFEQLGLPGLAALARTVAYAREQGLLVILDGKRNDIASTATAYAQAYLGPNSPWGSDALTISPYLGEDSLSPFIDVSRKQGAGVFILVKTSNPGSGFLQDRRVDERPIYEWVGRYVEEQAAATAGSSGYGIVGAVVGATYPDQLSELRTMMPHTWILVPGYGAQGGTAKDAARAVDARGLGAIVNNSRGIIFAHARPEYRERYGARRWQEAVEQATRDMIDELRAEIKVTG